MDSKNIFIACNHLHQTAQWEKPVEKEWRYCGKEDSFESDMVKGVVDTFFEDDEIYISVDRHDGKSIPKDNVIDEIERLIPKLDIKLADHKFRRIIEFNHYGIFRIGNK
jgi:hypothetical protein